MNRTPGPWRVSSPSRLAAHGCRTVIGPHRAHVAEVWNGSTRKQEVADANAALIAAAPDLLEALRGMVEKDAAMAAHFGSKWPVDLDIRAQSAKAAIAKAQP